MYYSGLLPIDSKRDDESSWNYQLSRFRQISGWQKNFVITVNISLLFAFLRIHTQTGKKKSAQSEVYIERKI